MGTMPEVTREGGGGLLKKKKKKCHRTFMGWVLSHQDKGQPSPSWSRLWYFRNANKTTCLTNYMILTPVVLNRYIFPNSDIKNGWMEEWMNEKLIDMQGKGTLGSEECWWNEIWPTAKLPENPKISHSVHHRYNSTGSEFRTRERRWGSPCCTQLSIISIGLQIPGFLSHFWVF